ncbi:MAG: iron-containing alcohol dehydrogenase [Sandaracinaceae bacterium]|nr:iron-containing alcohol dehydrogenase [Sandaracinaceae bacterium]
MPSGCQHDLELGPESAFSIDASSIVFGRGALRELGEHVLSLTHASARVALFTDPRLASLPPIEHASASLRAAGLDVVVYDRVHVEPTDASFLEAARFATEGRFEAYVSVGGGSVIDTTKAAALYATYPAPLLAYVNAPLGEGRVVPGPLPPHIACPTTCGTGSECTGIAVFDLLATKVKTGIASRRLRPALAIVDPDATRTLPSEVVAASGFDVLCHAIESYTARSFTARPAPRPLTARPMSQGQNPWSDLGSLEALRLAGRSLVRAFDDASDDEARGELMWAATLAGIAFGNAGVHLPHAMSYAVAGLVKGYMAPGYPSDEPRVPHGTSVVLNAPSVFRWTARTSPARHLTCAEALGADVRGATVDDAGEVLSGRLLSLMRRTRLPLGLAGVGYGEVDLDALAERAIVQRRLVDNAPCAVDRERVRALFEGALDYRTGAPR